jgi:hypothetical protein
MIKKKITQEEWDELQDHWKTIVNCVFRAEESLDEKYKQELQEAKNLPAEERQEACDKYTTAIANEILSYTFEV